MGISQHAHYQIVFSFSTLPVSFSYQIQASVESMLNFSEGALVDADVLIYVTDVVEDPRKCRLSRRRLPKKKIPVLLVITKIDLVAKEQKELEDLSPNAGAALP